MFRPPAHGPQLARNKSEELCPPKPKELLMAVEKRRPRVNLDPPNFGAQQMFSPDQTLVDDADRRLKNVDRKTLQQRFELLGRVYRNA